ncbi:hypothetical protein ACHHYP_02785 [Achlya hypogyna]|uniref:Uncharacterized protein n=1 Tax=Achlya hypogyna TaxID=1202772 RepID=A0A1V9Z5E3_ACHHY|nr:hypothetical protein ACHHYP_02785 [Achlya hypogyna]
MISLAHVKSSQAAADKAVLPRRIAWPGGKLVSNKEEALAKFLERKKAIAEGRSPAKTEGNKALTPIIHNKGHKRNAGHKVQPHGPSKPLHTKKRDYKHTKKSTVTFKGKNKTSKEELPTASKLSMSLDDIVKKTK